MRTLPPGGAMRRRTTNWRWPLRLWFNSPSEFWETVGTLAIIAMLSGLGWLIINRP